MDAFRGMQTAPPDKEDVVEPIAIIGMSCRFPQGATSPESFWQMLVEGRCANAPFPPDRININSFNRGDGNKLNKVSALSCGSRAHPGDHQADLVSQSPFS